MLNLLRFIYDTIGYWTPFAVIGMILINVFGMKIKLLYKERAIYTTNILLLISSILYIISIIVDFFIAYYSGGEYEQYVIWNRFIGPMWIVSLFNIVRGLLLPQLFWIGKMRYRLLYPAIVIVSNLLIALFTACYAYFSGASYWVRYVIPSPLLKLGIYLLLFVVTYLLISISRNRQLSATDI